MPQRVTNGRFDRAGKPHKLAVFHGLENCMRATTWISGFCLLAAMAGAQAAPLLLQTPSVSATRIAFAYGG